MQQLLTGALVLAVAAPNASMTSWTEAASAVAAIAGAVFSLGTLVVAVVAARYAKRQVDGAREQLDEARDLRREQAQPYVVLYAEPSPVSGAFIDLVIRNLGATAAFDVTVRVSPRLQRSDLRGGIKDVSIPAVIPILAPGQEWRMLWDGGPQRAELDLPSEHTGEVTYRDSTGQELSSPVLLSWDTLKDRSALEVYGIHHGAKALREIKKTLDQCVTGGSYTLKVTTRDGDALDAQERAEMKKHQWEQGGGQMS